MELKFGHLIEYNKKNIFLKKPCRKSGSGTSSRPLFVFQKSFVPGKNKLPAAQFQYLSIALNLAYNKSKLYKTLYRDMINFSFLEKGLGIISPPHFVYDFFKKNGSHVIYY